MRGTFPRTQRYWRDRKMTNPEQQTIILSREMFDAAMEDAKQEGYDEGYKDGLEERRRRR